MSNIFMFSGYNYCWCCDTIIAELNYMVLTMKSLQEYVPKRKDVVSLSVPDTGDIEKINMWWVPPSSV